MADVKLSDRAAYVKSILTGIADTFFMTQAEKTKIAGVQDGATANATNSELRDRGTHTGTQLVSTIVQVGTGTGLQALLDAKAASSHSHTTANITGLDATLASLATKPETFIALDDVGFSTPTPLYYLRWNSAGTMIEQVAGGGGGGSGGTEITTADTAAMLKVDKLSPTIYHPGPGTVTIAYLRIPVSATLNGIEVVAGSGSGTITVEKNGVALSGLSGQTINTTKATRTATGTGNDNWLAEGDELRFFLPTSSSLAEVRVYPLITRRY